MHRPRRDEKHFTRLERLADRAVHELPRARDDDVYLVSRVRKLTIHPGRLIDLDGQRAVREELNELPAARDQLLEGTSWRESLHIELVGPLG